MKLSKQVMSWLSSIVLVLGAVLEAFRLAQVDPTAPPDPSTPTGRILLVGGVVLMALRNIMNDTNKNGVPDFLERLLGAEPSIPSGPGNGAVAILLAVGLLAACAKPVIASPPPKLAGFALEIAAADTAKLSAVVCDAPQVGRCTLRFVGNVNGSALTFADSARAVVTANGPQQVAVHISYACQDGVPRRFTVHVFARAMNSQGVTGSETPDPLVLTADRPAESCTPGSVRTLTAVLQVVSGP